MDGTGDPDAVAAALAGLDDDVAAGRVDLVEYWRRRAAIEAGDPGAPPRRPASAPPGVEVADLSAGAPSLVPAAPLRPAGPEPAPAAGPTPRRPEDHDGAAERNIGRPAAHAPFAPPQGAVRLASGAVGQRGWWRWRWWR
jgi:hypothetical protein